MLFSISGQPSSGKSTLINALKERGYNVVENQYARLLAEKNGYNIEDISSDPDTCMKFHHDLLITKRDNEQHLISSREIWFTERGFIDFFIFLAFYFKTKFGVDAKTDIENFREPSSPSGSYGDLWDFYLKATAFDKIYYKKGFYIPKPVIIENDGFRITDDGFMKEQDTFISFLTRTEHNIVMIDETDIDERVKKIEQIIQPYIERIKELSTPHE